MNYLSVCSGIEAATCAWHGLGWHPVGFSEIEKFPSAVLAHHYPNTPNLGDMTKYKEWEFHGQSVDLLVGGTPCQSFSVAGLRKGLADPRGNLMLVFLGIADRLRPRWVVWENVPGVLSSGGGRDFGTFLGALAELGYGFAYRVLDAQYFGVPQRRRRVFVVGYLGDWRRAAAVLFEPESLRGNPAPSRKTGQGVAGNAPIGIDEECNATIDGYGPLLKGGQGGTRQAVCFGGNNQLGPIEKATACNAKGGSGRMDFETETFVTHALRGEGYGASEDGTGRGTPLVFAANARPDEMQFSSSSSSSALMKSQNMAVAFTQNQSGDGQTLPSMGTNQNATGRNTPKVMFDSSGDTLYDKGIMRGGDYASAQERNTVEVLRHLREEIGEKAFTEWGLGILNSLRATKILQSDLYGKDVRLPTFSRCWLVYCSLSREESKGEGAVRSVRESVGEGCSSFRWEPSEQRSRELGTYLSELSQPGAQARRHMQNMWEASEGPGVLQQTLSEVQKMGRPHADKAQSASSVTQVRRLTPECCEFLQGFPRNYTQVPFRGKPAAAGLRYKALGNSMAVPVMRWIGERIKQVEEAAHD